MFDNSNPVEDIKKELESQSIKIWPIRRERQIKDLNIELKSAKDIKSVWQSFNQGKVILNSQDAMPVVKGILQKKFDQSEESGNLDKNHIFFNRWIPEMMDQIWSLELPNEPLRVQWLWNKAETYDPVNFVPYDSKGH